MLFSHRCMHNKAWQLLLAGLLVFLGIFLVWPLGELVKVSLSDTMGNFSGLTNFYACLTTPGLLQAIRNTLCMGVAVTCITVVLAFTIAYGLQRAHIAGRRLAHAICLLPLFAPSLFPAVGLIYLFGGQGILKILMGNTDIYGPVGVLLGSIIFTLPHATLLLLTTLQSTDARLYEAARTLNASVLKQFWTITLPHARYGIISASLVVFILTITDFGVPKVLGGDFSMLATEIYKQVLGMQNFSLGAAVSLLLMLPSAGAFLVDSWARKKQARLFSSGTEQKIIPYRPRDVAFTIFVWAILGLLVMVFAMVVWGSFVRFWPYDFSFTLAHYDFSEVGEGMLPFVNSLVLAFGTALLGTCLMFSGAYVVGRCPVSPALSALYRTITLLPLSIPGTVLGLAYIFAFNKGGAAFAALSGSLPLLMLNSIIHFYTVGHLSAATRLQSLDPQYETVGLTLGVPRSTTFFRVVMPLSTRTLLDISLYLFVNALTTISALVFLYSPKTMPAAVFMLQVNDTGNTAAAAAVGTILLGLAFAARILYTVLGKRLD